MSSYLYTAYCVLLPKESVEKQADILLSQVEVYKPQTSPRIRISLESQDIRWAEAQRARKRIAIDFISRQKIKMKNNKISN